MTRLRLLRNLRSLLLAGGVLLLLTGVMAAVYLNEIGLTDNLRAKISEALRQKNVHATFGSIRFDILRGITARDVVIYRDADHQDELASFDRVSVAVDKTKALRGEIRLERLSCRNGRATLAIHEGSEQERRLTITDLRSELAFRRRDLLEIQDTTARLGRMNLELGASLLLNLAPPVDEDYETPIEQRENIAAIIDEITALRIPTGLEFNPKLKLRLDGDLKNPDLVRARFQLEAPALERADYRLSDLIVHGFYDRQLLSVEKLSFRDTTGAISVTGIYDFFGRQADLELTSDLDLQAFARRALEKELAPELVIAGESSITGALHLSPDESGQLDFRSTGRLSAKDVAFRSLAFDDFECRFSLGRDALYLRDINARNDDGGLTGRFLKKGSDLRYQASTTLPISSFRELFRLENTKKFLDQFTSTADTTWRSTLAGSGKVGQPETFVTNGSAVISQGRFNSVPLRTLSTDFSFFHQAGVLSNLVLDFDYADSPWRKKYGGPETAVLEMPKVEIDGARRLISIPSVKGDIWPEHALRLFLSNAPKLTERYRFHSPPTLTGTGVFDMDRSGARTDFTCSVQAGGRMDWEFLGKDLPLIKPSARLRFRKNLVDVTSLSAGLFSGSLQLNLKVASEGKDTPVRVAGAVKLAQAEVKEIAALYEIEAIDSGRLDTNLQFTIIDGKPASLQGRGALELTDTRLFSVPVFGPLSPLISGLLSDKRAGYERAKKASLTYVLKDGVAHFDDFVTTTRSLRFLGEGALNLKNQSFGMTLRMNGRGILQLLDLPLKPLMGLFQFTGEGTLKDPKWRSTPFVRPEAAREKFLIE